MPNFVTPSSTHAPALSSADPVDRAIQPVSTEQLGYFARREVKRHQEREVVSQTKGRISEERRQAEQVATLALQARGAIARAEIGRVTGESLAAVAGAAYESHKAITGVQGESRVLGTLANFEALNGHGRAIQEMVNKGQLTPEQAEIALRTAQAVHAETEQRMDKGYLLVRDATDATFTAALAPITSAMPKT